MRTPTNSTLSIPESERVRFQLSLLNLAYQGNLPEAVTAELEQNAAKRSPASR